MLMCSVVCRKANVSRLAQASIYVAIIASLLGCQPTTPGGGATTPTFSTPVVEKTILPPMTMTPTPECMPVIGVNLDVVPLSTSAVRVKITGLNPNEQVTFVFYSEVAGQTFRIESSHLEGAGENGSLEYIRDGLVDRTSGVPFKDWRVQVIHSRGVACATASLP